MTIFDVVAQYPRRWKHIDECRAIVEDFAKKLNKARRHLKKTHEQFALDNEISPSRIYNLCRGQVLPSNDELEILMPIINAFDKEIT